MTLRRLLFVPLFTAILASCAAPTPSEPLEIEPSGALLEECGQLMGLIEVALGRDGEIVGQPFEFLDREKRRQFLELKNFADGIKFKVGLTDTEKEKLQRLTTGIYSLEMTMRGNPVNADMSDIGAFWIDGGVRSIRKWCP